MTIRNAVPGDSGRIAEIYAHYVLDTAISFELVPPDAAEIGRRMAAFRPYPYIVAEENGIVIGYAYAHPLSERPAYRRSAEVTIYLDSAMQGKGIGKALYAELEKQLKSIDVHNLYAIVTYYRRDNIFIWEMAVFINVSDFAILVSDYSIGITYRFNRNNGVVI